MSEKKYGPLLESYVSSVAYDVEKGMDFEKGYNIFLAKLALYQNFPEATKFVHLFNFVQKIDYENLPKLIELTIHAKNRIHSDYYTLYVQYLLISLRLKLHKEVKILEEDITTLVKNYPENQFIQFLRYQYQAKNGSPRDSLLLVIELFYKHQSLKNILSRAIADAFRHYYEQCFLDDQITELASLMAKFEESQLRKKCIDTLEYQNMINRINDRLAFVDYGKRMKSDLNADLEKIKQEFSDEMNNISEKHRTSHFQSLAIFTAIISFIVSGAGFISGAPHELLIPLFLSLGLVLILFVVTITYINDINNNNKTEGYNRNPIFLVLILLLLAIVSISYFNKDILSSQTVNQSISSDN